MIRFAEALILLLLVFSAVLGRETAPAEVRGEIATAEVHSASDSQSCQLVGTSDTPRPTGPPLPADLIPILEQKMKRWMECWELAIPDFALGMLREVRRDTIRDRWQYPYESEKRRDEEQRQKYLYVWSPDSTKAVDPLRGFGFWEKDGQIKGGWDVDTDAVLIDMEAGLLTILLSCGTPCSMDNAWWIDDSRFVVAGSGEVQFEPFRVAAMLYLFDLGRDSVYVYHSPWLLHEQRKLAYPCQAELFRQRLPDGVLED